MLAKEINSSMCSHSDDHSYMIYLSWIILKCIFHESSLNLKRGVQKAGRYLNLLKQRFSSHAKKAGLQVNELQFLFPVALVDAGVFTKPGEERWKLDGFLISCSALFFCCCNFPIFGSFAPLLDSSVFTGEERWKWDELLISCSATDALHSSLAHLPTCLTWAKRRSPHSYNYLTN